MYSAFKPLNIEKKLTVQTLSTTAEECFFGGGQQNGYFTHKGQCHLIECHWGQSYKKGIGALSGSEIVYKLDGSWDKLKGHVGMDGGQMRLNFFLSLTGQALK